MAGAHRARAIAVSALPAAGSLEESGPEITEGVMERLRDSD
ncbi:hypothetical protein OG292_01735 [Streptomyces sp. NBC_01511]